MVDRLRVEVVEVADSNTVVVGVDSGSDIQVGVRFLPASNSTGDEFIVTDIADGQATLRRFRKWDGSVAGAAFGTAVLPGIGTVIGGLIGSAAAQLFLPPADRSPRVGDHLYRVIRKPGEKVQIDGAPTGESDLVYDLRFPEGDGKVFFIVRVDPNLHEEFKRLLKTPQVIDLRDYGEILHSGYGEPSDALKAELKDKYGMYQGEGPVDG